MRVGQGQWRVGATLPVGRSCNDFLRPMNPTTPQQIIGTVSAGLAALLVLLRIGPFLSEWERKQTTSDLWVTPAMGLLAPVCGLLMIALLAMTAGGGFDWMRLSRPKLYVLAVAAAFALAAATFVFIAFYLRPGFTPRGLYRPFIYLITFSTVLMVVVSLNQKLIPGLSVQWMLRTWAWLTALSLVGTLVFAGRWIAVNGPRGLSSVAIGIIVHLPASKAELAEIARLDPMEDFDKLVRRAGGVEKPAVRAAAAARLRSHPGFVDRMAAMLKSGSAEPALLFVRDAELTPDEKSRFAGPARAALEGWVNQATPSNFTTSDHFKRERRLGDELFRVLPEKFAGTGVDFSEVKAFYEDKMK